MRLRQGSKPWRKPRLPWKRFGLKANHLSLSQRGHEGIRARLAKLLPEETATTVITFEEQMCGWLALISKATTAEPRIRAYKNEQ